MHKIKLLSLIIFALTLTSCSNTLLKYSEEEFRKNERAVVFFDIKEDNISIPFEIYHYEKNETFDVFHKNRLLSSSDLVKRMMFLEPGTYFIGRIDLLTKNSYPGKKIRWLPGPPINDNRRVEHGAFSVKAGEVLSLGILHYKSKQLVLERNFLELKRQLADSDNSLLKEKLKKGVFYERNSYVMKDTTKGVRVIPIEVVDWYMKDINKSIKKKFKRPIKN